MNKILEVCNVSKKYNTIDGEIKALEDITEDINTLVNIKVFGGNVKNNIYGG